MKHYSSPRRIGVSTVYTVFFIPFLPSFLSLRGWGKNVHLLPSFSRNFPKFGNRRPRLSQRFRDATFCFNRFFTVYYRSSLSLLFIFLHTNCELLIVYLKDLCPLVKIKRGKEGGTSDALSARNKRGNEGNV